MPPPVDLRAGAALVACCRRLAAAGLAPAAAGNLSVRVGEQVLVTGSGARFASLDEDDLVLVEGPGERSGEVVAGTARPTSELALHLETYRHRPDVGAVVHTHGRRAVALSTVTDVVPALHYYCLDLGGAVPVAPYRTYGTADLAEVTTDALAERGAVVMAHHGSLAVGADLDVAASRAELLEWLCEVALLARAAGEPRELDERDLDAVRRQTQHRTQHGSSS